MNPWNARRFIDKNFRAKLFNDSTGNSISTDVFLEVLNSIESTIPFTVRKKNENLERFLWSGCRKFNRWFSPSPYVVPSNFAENHERFAKALARASPHSIENAAVFLLHAIRDDLYLHFNSVPLPLSEKQLQTLSEIYDRAKKVPIPRNEIKQDEFKKHYTILSDTISRLRDGTLRTECSCTLPYPIVKRPIICNLKWGAISADCRFVPSFLVPDSLMTKAAAETAIVPKVSSRWQFGTTKMSFLFSSLIDHSISVSALQMPMGSLPEKEWPNIFHLVFQIIYESTWRLRDHDDFIGVWVPSPADLGDIEYRLLPAPLDQSSYMRKSNPALLIHGFSKQSDFTSTTIDIGTMEVTDWSERCRILAEQYLNLGDNREAIFWLNVGIESLLQERMTLMINSSKTEISINDLTGGPSYWDAARTLVEEQSAEVAHKIRWPETAPTIPSMFRRINFIAKHISLKESSRKISAHYSKIQRHRNSLFHGDNDQSIAALDVRNAIESFDWLKENFQLAR